MRYFCSPLPYDFAFWLCSIQSNIPDKKTHISRVCVIYFKTSFGDIYHFFGRWNVVVASRYFKWQNYDDHEVMQRLRASQLRSLRDGSPQQTRGYCPIGHGVKWHTAKSSRSSAHNKFVIVVNSSKPVPCVRIPSVNCSSQPWAMYS